MNIFVISVIMEFTERPFTERLLSKCKNSISCWETKYYSDKSFVALLMLSLYLLKNINCCRLLEALQESRLNFDQVLSPWVHPFVFEVKGKEPSSSDNQMRTVLYLFLAMAGLSGCVTRNSGSKSWIPVCQQRKRLQNMNRGIQVNGCWFCFCCLSFTGYGESGVIK